VLLVDDTADTRRVLRRMLERDGFSVLEADRGTEGIRLAMCHRIQLIVLDVNMPGLDGLSVCEILKTEPATCRIPVLVCTVRMENEDQLRAASVGADGFLGKPFSSERLLTTVHLLLENKTKNVPQKS
jgi:CheY-like chemotaxis protein